MHNVMKVMMILKYCHCLFHHHCLCTFCSAIRNAC